VREEEEVRIEGLGSAGDGVGRLASGRVVFVPKALPGDVVRVRLTRTTKQVQYAELLTLLTPSPDRIDAHCHERDCGGCALKELSISAQVELKRRRVVETLRRIGGVDIEAMLGEVKQVGDGWRVRHRVHLHAQWSGTRWRLGYFARHSRYLVEVASCPILWSELEQTAVELVHLLEGLPEEAQLSASELAYSRRDGRAAVKLEGRGPMVVFRRWLEDAVDMKLGGVAIEAPGQSFWHGNLELRYDHRHAHEFDLRFEPGVFTQASPQMNDELVEAVVNAARPAAGKRLLELHAGIGNFSIPLKRAGVDLVAVEHQRRAAILCRRNAQLAGFELEVRPESDARAVSELSDFAVVLLDPPRTGAREAAEAIAKSSVERVVYVACDVATLARDTAILAAGGFQPVAVATFDMFPQTPLVEVMLAFSRRG
jgi:23S rRNA (uracil1939-C5)-methyltransferase